MRPQFYLAAALLCALVSPCAAQMTIEPGKLITYTVEQDSLFAPLNKGRIPYGVLYNRVFPFAQVDALESGDTVSTALWIQALSEMQRATYGFQLVDSQLNYENARDFVFAENVANRLPLTVLRTGYGLIDTNAYRDGRLVQEGDGLWHDGPNLTSPYLDRTLTLAALGVAKSLETETAYTVFQAADRGTGTVAPRIASISMYDATEERLYQFGNETLEIQFDRPGKHWVKLHLLLFDGTALDYWQFLNVYTKTITGPCETPIKEIYSEEPFVGYDETSTSTSWSIGEYKIFYRTNEACDNKVKKPIIITDAWDPGDDRQIRNF